MGASLIQAPVLGMLKRGLQAESQYTKSHTRVMLPEFRKSRFVGKKYSSRLMSIKLDLSPTHW
jgi:hypothetical protein